MLQTAMPCHHGEEFLHHQGLQYCRSDCEDTSVAGAMGRACRAAESDRAALACRALASSAALSSAAGARSVSVQSSRPGARSGAATSAAVGAVPHTTTASGLPASHAASCASPLAVKFADKGCQTLQFQPISLEAILLHWGEGFAWCSCYLSTYEDVHCPH